MILNTKYTIVFFGSSDYCLPVLEAINRNFQLVGIITKVKQIAEQFAKSHNIRYFTPHNRNELLNLKNQIEKLRPDLAIVADYGLIIPKEIFTIPRFKTLNIHFSKLPDLRGPTPVQYTILKGDTSAWISVIVMDEGIDTGDIVWQKPFDFAQGKEFDKETTESLYRKLFQKIAEELPTIINKYSENKLTPQKQDHTKATYTKLLKRGDGFIPLKVIKDAIQGEKITSDKLKEWKLFDDLSTKSLIHDSCFIPLIERSLRAFSPWPGVWTELTMLQCKKRLKILKAHLEPITNNHELITKLCLDEVQLEGKKPVSWKQFLEGHPQVMRQLL